MRVHGGLMGSYTPHRVVQTWKSVSSIKVDISPEQGQRVPSVQRCLLRTGPALYRRPVSVRGGTQLAPAKEGGSGDI
jgi:hypothetical protein